MMEEGLTLLKKWWILDNDSLLEADIPPPPSQPSIWQEEETGWPLTTCFLTAYFFLLWWPLSATTGSCLLPDFCLHP